MKIARLAPLVALLSLSIAGPALAVSGDGIAAGPGYATSFVPQYGVGSYAGIMKLTISSDGIISGVYRNEDSGRFTPVTGGLVGDRVHLDFNWVGPTHVEGKYDGTTIHGSTYRDGHVYLFSAVPDAS
jgi:hypothetical protein